MHIALVHDWLTGMRGGEKCLEPVCRRFPTAPLFTLLHVPGSATPTIERMAIHTSVLQRLPGVRHYYRLLLPLMPGAIERLRVPAGVDLVLSFSHAVAKGVRVPAGVPHVCYCFTPMRYAWHRRDDYLRTGPFGVGPLRLVAQHLLERLRRWDRQSSSRVTHFVAISHTVARRIEHCYGRTSTVIYPPVDTQFYTPAPVPREDYYVCVSALVPYKRVDLAIAACRRLGRRLVVIGAGPERRRLARQAGPGITLTGWLPDAEVREHLRRARALLFPAHEDFGIVPLEAQACGTPVVALGEGGAVETVLPASADRPGTGLLFAGQTVDSLTAAIEQFEHHPDWFDPALARCHAERFATERFERELFAYVEEVVRSFGPGTRAGKHAPHKGPG
jgi:glycosyltransferase involved in cell wall biosynthesis